MELFDPSYDEPSFLLLYLLDLGRGQGRRSLIRKDAVFVPVVHTARNEVEWHVGRTDTMRRTLSKAMDSCTAPRVDFAIDESKAVVVKSVATVLIDAICIWWDSDVERFFANDGEELDCDEARK